MARVVLLLGGNIGDVKESLAQARELLTLRVGDITACSTEMETQAWGFSCEVKFLNQALVIETTLKPLELLIQTQSIECEVGRDRALERDEKEQSGERYASRIIDIDIITYDTEVVEEESLKIPHPLMHQREFVLRPMAEVAPQWRHPLLNATAEELLKEIQ